MCGTLSLRSFCSQFIFFVPLHCIEHCCRQHRMKDDPCGEAVCLGNGSRTNLAPVFVLVLGLEILSCCLCCRLLRRI